METFAVMTARQCVRRAFDANLRGDFQVGDRWAQLARNIIAADLRIMETGDKNLLMLGEPILVPDVSFHETRWWC
jgi:hypothetical protein